MDLPILLEFDEPVADLTYGKSVLTLLRTWLMDDPTEHALVVQALTCGLSNCVVWCNDGTMLRIRSDPDLRGLTARSIKQELLAFVGRGGEIVQVVEQREGHRLDYRFYYKAIVPFDDFPRGLFAEMRLIDDDPEFPVVQIVNAHPQRTWQ